MISTMSADCPFRLFFDSLDDKSSLSDISTDSKNSQSSIDPLQSQQVSGILDYCSTKSEENSNSDAEKSCNNKLSDERANSLDIMTYQRRTRGKGSQVASSMCFLVIVKYYYLLNEEVGLNDILKLQLLNRRCYDQLIPMAMSQLSICPEVRPCSLTALEHDIQELIKEKKSLGIIMKSASILTLQLECSPKNYRQAACHVDAFLDKHPYFS